MVLGITDTGKTTFEHYETWVRTLAPAARIIKLSHADHNADELLRCDGLMLTGGGDIHPRFYGRTDGHDVVKDVNTTRDEFEFHLVEAALRMKLPILGICRGMQVFNVAMGGSMMLDVQQAGFGNHSKKKEEPERVHAIEVVQGTMLHEIVGENKGEVNTNHHQAVDRLGEGLRAAALSADGLVEALEWEDSDRRPFLLLVQWHPERMYDVENPCSKGVLTTYMHALNGSARHRISSHIQES